MNSFVKISCLILILTSCSKDVEKMNSSEFVKWYSSEESGLRCTTVVGNLEFTWEFLSPEYIALSEKGSELNSSYLEKRRAELKNLEVYILRISLTDRHAFVLNKSQMSHNEYQNAISYFSLDFENDIYLISGSDSLSPSIFHFERTYGMSPYLTFNVAFQKNKIKSEFDRVLSINAHAFNLTPVNGKIMSSDINNMPELIELQHD